MMQVVPGWHATTIHLTNRRAERGPGARCVRRVRRIQPPRRSVPANCARPVPLSATASRPATAAAPPAVAALLPLLAVVVIAFLGLGLALPVLPLHGHDDLGLGTVGVGLV